MANIKAIFGGSFVPPQPEAPEPVESQFRNAFIEAGLEPPNEIIMDGQLHRFKTGGNKTFDKSGWYSAHIDGFPTLVFGDWRQGIEQTFKANIGRKITVAEEMENLARIAKAKSLRDEERHKKNEIAASTVETIWETGAEATTEHPYFKKKGIQPHGAKVTGDGRLMLPLYGDDGKLSTLQYIDAEGNKIYHPGGATKGKFAIIGTVDTDGPIYIAEGFATAATIHQEMSRPCVAAFSASNLVPVTEIIRSKFGIGQEIVIVADNDKSGIGQRYAEQASAKYGVRYVMPDIDGDANDYVLAGHDLKLLLKPTTNTEIISKMQTIFADELSDEYQAPDELIENLMTIGGSTVLYGDSNSGKTFFALSMAAAVATGNRFFGRQTDKGAVVYLATESPSSVMTRIQAMKKHMEISLENLAVVPVPVNFYSNDGDAADVVELVKAVSEAKNMPVHLIIGDTLARMSAGANENSGEDMAPVMARFDQVAKATGAAITIIHHNGKNAAAGARGWSGIRAHIDTEIEVTVEDDVRMATVTKQRELPGKGDVLYFKLEIVEMGISKFGGKATTCIAVEDENGSSSVKKNDKPKSEKLFNTLKDAWFYSKCEYHNNEPYITKSSLINYFEVEKGLSHRTALNKVDSSRSGDFINLLISENRIYSIQNGWAICDDGWCSVLNLTSKNPPQSPSRSPQSP
jgi:phage/plasmid primase-like uncharacterized protein/KaiC/GvpD/RAD55 family RecA-like ATPase